MPNDLTFGRRPHSLRTVAAAALFAVFACGDSGGPADKPDPAPNDTPVKATIEPASDAQVAFLIADCVETGVAQDKCACAGNAAKTALGAELAVKMSKQPAAGDPAMATYYTSREINTVMQWIKDASKACGIEEAQ